MNTQTTFIVTTKPATRASQLKEAINFGAANNIATVKAILIASQKKNPAIAAPGLADAA